MPTLDPSHPAQDRLIAAVLASDIASARTALADGADANTWRDYDECWDRTRMDGREPVLLCAARQGQVDLVTLLLQHGADPDARDSLSGRTALVAAAARGDLPGVHALLGHRAALEIVDGPSGDTAFAAAIAGGHAEVAAVLLTAGALATGRALGNACHLGRIDLAAACVQHGASPAQHRVLDTAARAGHLPMVRWLLDHGADLANEGRNALCEAANAGQADVVTFLLEQGVPTDCYTSFGWPPLHLAAWNGDAATVAALLRAGADPRATDREGMTALEHAQAAGKAANVALLARA